jgi:3-oxoadipate enol-lactonase
VVSSGVSGWDFSKDAVLAEHQTGLRQAAQGRDLDGIVEWFQRSWTDGPARTPGDVDPAVRERVRVMARANVGRNSPGNYEEVNAVPRIGEIHVPMLAILGELDMPSIRPSVLGAYRR